MRARIWGDPGKRESGFLSTPTDFQGRWRGFILANQSHEGR